MVTASTREQMNETAQSAKDAAEATLGRQKDRAADTLDGLAGTLRKAAQESDDGRQGASMANWAADGLQRISSTLHNKELGDVLRDVESFARRQPAAFFFTAAAAGFLATRFLKAGTETGDRQPEPLVSSGNGASGSTDTLSTTAIQ